MAVWDGRSIRPPYQLWLADALAFFDSRLRRNQAVFEYTDNPACIFRLDIEQASRSLVLVDGTQVALGQRLARLHYWNEHVPAIPEHGATIGWARRMQRAIAVSLRELAHYLSLRSDLADIAVICADVPSATRTQSGQLARIMAHYGFETLAGSECLPVVERLHRLGENVLISLIVFAHNPRALRADTLTRVRVPIYLSRRNLEERFAGRTSGPSEAQAA